MISSPFDVNLLLVDIPKKQSPSTKTWDALDDTNSHSSKLGGKLEDKISSCKLP